MIKIIVSDLGNVLIPFDYQIAIDRFNTVEVGLGEKFADFAAKNYDLHRAFERGDIAENEFIDRMLSAVDNRVDRETFCRFYSEIFTENFGVTEILPRLKQRFRLVLLSNTNGVHQRFGWQHYTFLHHFEKLILSHEIGSVKPEEKIYRAVESYTGALPEEHIFIDDVLAYAEGARKCGWDAIHYTDPASLKNELAKRDLFTF